MHASSAPSLGDESRNFTRSASPFSVTSTSNCMAYTVSVRRPLVSVTQAIIAEKVPWGTSGPSFAARAGSTLRWLLPPQPSGVKTRLRQRTSPADDVSLRIVLVTLGSLSRQTMGHEVLVDSPH